MRRFLIPFALWLSLGGLAIGQTTPPTPDPIHWPVTPVPTPTPSAIGSMAADQVYVIGIDVDAVVLASPAGIVTVNTEAGPVKIRAKFVGGVGIETKTFANKTVVTVEPAGNGRVELMVVYGGLSTGKVERRLLDVDGVVPPIPPGPPTPPIPPAPSDAFAQAVQAAYAAETDAAKAVQVAQLAAIFRLGSGLANDQTVLTTADLLARMQAGRKVVLPDTALTGVRAVIQTELNRTLATPITFDAQSRATVAALLAKVATTLEAIK